MKKLLEKFSTPCSLFISLIMNIVVKALLGGELRWFYSLSFVSGLYLVRSKYGADTVLVWSWLISIVSSTL